VFTLPQRETGKPEQPDVWAFGYTTSFRMGQIIQYGFTPPTLGDDVDLDRVMRTTFVDALRTAFKQAGWARTDNGVEETGQFLVGVKGRLFTVDADYQVGEPADGYAAVGCGHALAAGSLHTSRALGWEPSRRVTAALEAAAHHSAGVVDPFTLVTTREASGSGSSPTLLPVLGSGHSCPLLHGQERPPERKRPELTHHVTEPHQVLRVLDLPPPNLLVHRVELIQERIPTCSELVHGGARQIKEVKQLRGLNVLGVQHSIRTHLVIRLPGKGVLHVLARLRELCQDRAAKPLLTKLLVLPGSGRGPPSVGETGR
jgi:hypothetical protein